MKKYSVEECEERLKSIYSNMTYPRNIGAIPEERWKKFLEEQLNENGDLYIPEQVLKIIEQLAVNNNIDNALEIYDSMLISSTGFDEVTKIVQEHFPVMGEQAQVLLGKTYNEFLVRANSKASYERTHFSNTKKSIKSKDSKKDISTIRATTIKECEEGLKSIYSNMTYPRNIGAIPEERWKKFLEEQLKENGDLYIPEQVLKIIEQLAVNNNIDNALEIYDSMLISSTGFDEVTKIVQEHFPVMGEQAEVLLGKTYNEFLVRANSKASCERTHFSSRGVSQILLGEATKDALKSGTTLEEFRDAGNKEQNLEITMGSKKR